MAAAASSYAAVRSLNERALVRVFQEIGDDLYWEITPSGAQYVEANGLVDVETNRKCKECRS